MRYRFLVVWICLLLPFRVFAQEVLQTNISVKRPQPTISELLYTISEQSDISFSYDSKLFDAQQSLQLPSASYTLEDLLRLIFRNQGIDFVLRGNHVILKPHIFSSEAVHLKGRVLDSLSQLPLMGATLYLPQQQKGTICDSLGNFSLRLGPGLHEIQLSLLGYKTKRSQVFLPSDTSIFFLLSPDTLQMQEVMVSSKQKEKEALLSEPLMGKNILDMESIRRMPALFGEADVLRSIQLLPGIQSAGEGLSGLMVRGGSADQTLVMLNDAIIYSPSHLLGLFSVFNPEVIRDVEIYKGGIPARWGGRLSSIINTQSKTGNEESYALSGGLGLISSRLSVEGPILKNKASFLVSGRRTYLDLILKAAQGANSQPPPSLFFYDFNTSLQIRPNKNNQLRFFTYHGKDAARFFNFLRLHWKNRILSGEWLHTFNSKLLMSSSFHQSDFGYGFNTFADDELNFNWTSRIREYSGRLDFDYNPRPGRRLNFGYHAAKRTFFPVIAHMEQNKVVFTNIRLDQKHGLEHALYLQHEEELSPRLSLLLGLRYSAFHNIGPGRVFVYQDGQEKSLETISDTLQYDSRKIFHSSHGPEPRFMARYSLNGLSSVKFSYNRMRQYTHVASGATASLPTDRWIPADRYIEPQLADQWSTGYFRQLPKHGIDFSAELYYKIMRNQIDFRNGVIMIDQISDRNNDIQFNNALETQLLSGRAWSYGLELMLRREAGPFKGWISYTLSRTRRQIAGINQDRPYSPRYDRPHDLNIVGSYQLSRRISFSGNWIFTSGNAVTLPEGKYTFEGMEFPYYNPDFRNNQRLPDYHRMDLSLTLYGRKNHLRRWQSNWSFSVYNAYMRKNPIFIQFTDVINNDPSLLPSEAGEIHSRELKGVMNFFSIIPAVSYNFRF